MKLENKIGYFYFSNERGSNNKSRKQKSSDECGEL